MKLIIGSSEKSLRNLQKSEITLTRLQSVPTKQEASIDTINEAQQLSLEDVTRQNDSSETIDTSEQV